MTKSKFGKGGKSIHRGAQATHGRRRDSPQDTLEISHKETNDIPCSRSTIDKNQYQSHERVEEESFMSHDARETNDIVHRSGSRTNNENSQPHIKDARPEIKVYKGKKLEMVDRQQHTSYSCTRTRKSMIKRHLLMDNVVQLTKRLKANHESVEESRYKKTILGLCGHLGFSTESVQIKGKQSVELENYTSDSSDDDDESRSQEGSMDYGDEEDSESDSSSMDSGNEDF
ncbi:OLC1v1004915C1 [Oldenlandia corymbosa var. corymbosa]|uniref:OLC1v1004915C1 n=1 Tax=Oldenlandia corymbosa var. corymbosa TaxID=529605 RepID=A0AAV1DFG5_OLDCO|nr:OLC1v1004915C1 [Oldenlandia corymbosa var. corymbosa]